MVPFPPKIIHFNTLFHDFHHPFWGVSPLFFRETSIYGTPEAAPKAAPEKSAGPGPGPGWWEHPEVEDFPSDVNMRISPKKAQKNSAKHWFQHRWYIYIYVYIYIYKYFFWGGQFGMESGDWCFFYFDVCWCRHQRKWAAKLYAKRVFFWASSTILK